MLEFIVNLVIARSIFDFTLNVTELLQTEQGDVSNSVYMIESLIRLVHEVCKNIDANHKIRYGNGMSLLFPNITKRKSPTVKRQTNRQLLKFKE